MGRPRQALKLLTYPARVLGNGKRNGRANGGPNGSNGGAQFSDYLAKLERCAQGDPSVLHSGYRDESFTAMLPEELRKTLKELGEHYQSLEQLRNTEHGRAPVVSALEERAKESAEIASVLYQDHLILDDIELRASQNIQAQAGKSTAPAARKRLFDIAEFVRDESIHGALEKARGQLKVYSEFAAGLKTERESYDLARRRHESAEAFVRYVGQLEKLKEAVKDLESARDDLVGRRFFRRTEVMAGSLGLDGNELSEYEDLTRKEIKLKNQAASNKQHMQSLQDQIVQITNNPNMTRESKDGVVLELRSKITELQYENRDCTFEIGAAIKRKVELERGGTERLGEVVRKGIQGPATANRTIGPSLMANERDAFILRREGLVRKGVGPDAAKEYHGKLEAVRHIEASAYKALIQYLESEMSLPADQRITAGLDPQLIRSETERLVGTMDQNSITIRKAGGETTGIKTERSARFVSSKGGYQPQGEIELSRAAENAAASHYALQLVHEFVSKKFDRKNITRTAKEFQKTQAAFTGKLKRAADSLELSVNGNALQNDSLIANTLQQESEGYKLAIGHMEAAEEELLSAFGSKDLAHPGWKEELRIQLDDSLTEEAMIKLRIQKERGSLETVQVGIKEIQGQIAHLEPIVTEGFKTTYLTIKGELEKEAQSKIDGSVVDKFAKRREQIVEGIMNMELRANDADPQHDRGTISMPLLKVLDNKGKIALGNAAAGATAGLSGVGSFAKGGGYDFVGGLGEILSRGHTWGEAVWNTLVYEYNALATGNRPEMDTITGDPVIKTLTAAALLVPPAAAWAWKRWHERAPQRSEGIDVEVEMDKLPSFVAYGGRITGMSKDVERELGIRKAKDGRIEAGRTAVDMLRRWNLDTSIVSPDYRQLPGKERVRLAGADGSELYARILTGNKSETHRVAFTTEPIKKGQFSFVTPGGEATIDANLLRSLGGNGFEVGDAVKITYLQLDRKSAGGHILQQKRAHRAMKTARIVNGQTRFHRVDNVAQVRVQVPDNRPAAKRGRGGLEHAQNSPYKSASDHKFAVPSPVAVEA